MAPTPQPVPARSRAALVATAAVLALAVAGFAAQQWLAGREVRERRDAWLADVDATLASDPIDTAALSRLVALLRKLPEHDTDRELRFAEARIELARDRADRARELVLDLAIGPSAQPAEQSLGARILLRLHENGVAAGQSSEELLGPASALAGAAARSTNDPYDLLREWQAAERAGKHDRAKEAAATLAAEHAGSAAARFVALAAAFDPAAGPRPVLDVLADCRPEPIEGRAMLAFAQLQTGDLAAATATCEAALAQAGGVAVVRFAAAITYHACVLGSAEGSPDRDGWVRRRNQHIDWLLAEPGVDDDRRAKVRPLRDVR